MILKSNYWRWRTQGGNGETIRNLGGFTYGKIPGHLNIRQKVMVGLIAGILAIGVVGIISYHYLGVI